MAQHQQQLAACNPHDPIQPNILQICTFAIVHVPSMMYDVEDAGLSISSRHVRLSPLLLLCLKATYDF